jgi:hypothetical protein
MSAQKWLQFLGDVHRVWPYSRIKDARNLQELTSILRELGGLSQLRAEREVACFISEFQKKVHLATELQKSPAA